MLEPPLIAATPSPVSCATRNDDGEIERGFLIKNLLPTCSLNDGSLVIQSIDRYVSIYI